FFSLGAVAKQPFHRHIWLNASNTPVAVNDILQDEEGYIWIGTDNGLLRYDGRSLTMITDSVHQPVTAIATSGDKVYTGHRDGTIGYVQGGVLTRYAISYNAPRSKI